MRYATVMVLVSLVGVPHGPAAAESAAGTSGAAQRKSVSITVYNDDLGLVRETRDVTLSSGDASLRFMDVAARIDPRTVHIASVTAPAARLQYPQR